MSFMRDDSISSWRWHREPSLTARVAFLENQHKELMARYQELDKRLTKIEGGKNNGRI